MRNQSRIVALLFLFIVFTGCTKKDDRNLPPAVNITPPPDFGFKVVGYFPYYRDPATVPDIKFRMTNVVNYAFFTVNASGILVLNNPSVFVTIVSKSKSNKAKIFMSISGSHPDFSSMAATQPGRNGFIKQVMNNMRKYQLDGVDMDWEFPRTSDGTDLTFTALMKELSDSCHLNARFYVTAAITAGKYSGAVRDAIRTELFNYVDWFNVMAYDDFNISVPYRHHSDFFLAQTSHDYWVTTRGMPMSKFILGIPAYGRPSGISQTNTVLSYAQILNQGGNPQSDSAIVVSAGHLTPYTIYYNGLATVKRKAMLAKQSGNGIMMWEKWHDSHDATSLLKAICDTIGRSY